jgi:hypothetical protein
MSKVWHAQTGQEVGELPDADNPLVKERDLYNQLNRNGYGKLFLSPDGTTAAIVDRISSGVGLLNLKTGQKRTIGCPLGLRVLSAAFFPDGRYLALGTKEDRVCPDSGKKERYCFIELLDLSRVGLELHGARGWLARVARA